MLLDSRVLRFSPIWETDSPLLLAPRSKAVEPAYQPLSPHPAEASGHFTIDLFQMTNFPRTPMTYFLTAFSGQAVSQALPIAIVSQQMIGG